MRAAIALVLLLAAPAQAADVSILGDQVILSGKVANNELAQLRDAAAEHGDRITTVILRELRPGGGEFMPARMAAEFIRDRGWRTAVSGACSGACAILFLGGVSRHFTDDMPPERTRIGFTGWYFLENTRRRGYGKNEFSPMAADRARIWIKEITQGKMNDEVLDRFVPGNWSEEHYITSFFDSRRFRADEGASVFVCSTRNPVDRKRDNCQKLATDVYREGIVTSAEIIRSNDRAAAAPAAPQRPASR